MLRAHYVTAAHPVSRLVHAVVVVAAAAVAAVTLAGTADAAEGQSCAEQVVADWYDNGRVDFVYPLKCYRQAIKSLPPDVKDYSTAKEVIERALTDAANRPRVTKPTPISEVGCKKGERCVGPPAGGSGGPGGPGSPGSGPGETPGGSGTGETAEEPDTSGPSSVPIPLIVLGGLALLLLAAGSAGYLARRFGHGGDGDGEPPAAI